MTKTSKEFLGKDFLLENEYGVQLYEQYAATVPIVDFHSHLSPKDIAEDRRFTNITEAWLEGDHYKWRAMRANGIAEKFCSGDASPKEKFLKWAETVPYTMRNPLYHWTHLELKNYFGITECLSLKTAETIFENCNAQLGRESFSVQGLLRKMNVEVACTTDDPTDSLEHHRHFNLSNAGFKMFPTFRPDKVYKLDNSKSFNQYLETLEKASKTSIHSFDDLLQALSNRIDFFHSHGCRVSDHGLESLNYENDAIEKAPVLFKKIRQPDNLNAHEQSILRCALLINLSQQYHARGWAQQFHLGAIRNNNTRKFNELGPDMGFDSIGEFPQIASMQKFFDHLNSTDQLAKTIVYNLNPTYNELFATMAANFNDGITPGKMQFGSAWWFLDQKDGIEKQLNTLSNMGLLSRFVGMVTDSRSFLSYPRHEYFRRILCNLIGKDIANGELPKDIPWLGKMVQDICYHNAKNYFGFDKG
jgi:glucuronate isomerase